MKRNKRNHNPGFKADIAMTALRGKYSVKEIAAHFNVNPSLVHAWRQLLSSAASELFAHKKSEDETDQPSVKSLDRKLDELQAEQEWMRRALAAMPLRDKRSCVETENGEISILGQARLLGLHRSGVYYKSSREKSSSESREENPAESAVENATVASPSEDILEPSAGTASTSEF